MIKNDFEEMYNHASMAATFLIRLLLSLIITFLCKLADGFNYLRELTYKQPIVEAPWAYDHGMQELRTERILSDNA